MVDATTRVLSYRIQEQIYIKGKFDQSPNVDVRGKAKKVANLPPEKEIYNLFDGIITFTQSHVRDDWIKQNFQF